MKRLFTLSLFVFALLLVISPAAELSWSAASAGSSGQLLIRQAAAGVKLGVFDGIRPIGATIPDTDGSASISLPGLAPGIHKLRAVEWGSGRVVAGPVPMVVSGTTGIAFRVPSYYATGTVQTAFASGDLDGDGLSDFAFAGRDGVTLLLSKTPGETFRVSISGVFVPVAVVILDLNGDGLNDVAVALSDGNVATLMNRGSGVLAAPVYFRAGARTSALVAADFNGDGIPDLAAADQASGNIEFLFGRGDGTFERGTVVHSGQNPDALAVADFNNDGIAELAIADFGNASISLLTRTTAGEFVVKQILPMGSGPWNIAVGDFNEDGYDDLIAVRQTDKKVCLLLSSERGEFLSPVVVGSASDVLVMDADGDGHLDLVFHNSASLSVELGYGDGTFTDGPRTPLPSASIRLMAGDFNGDGISDIASLDLTGVLAVMFGEAPAVVAGNLVEGSPLRQATSRGPKAMAGTTPVTLSLSTSANPAIFGQPLTVTATASPGTATGYVTFYDGTTVLGTESLAGGQAVLTTEFVSQGNRSLHAWYGGNATYTSAMSVTLPQSILTLPQSGFTAKTDYSVSGVPYAVATGDFNGDGKMDLAVANSGANTVGILLGNGNGTFQAQTTSATDTAPYALAVADFNRDGKLDLAVANRTGNDVSILLGNGDGSFQAAVSVGAGTNPQSVAVGDLNGDGIADLAIANAGSNNLTVLFGNGDGTFGTGNVFSAGTSPWSIAVSDFNGDGRADLVVANNGSGNVSVLLGNGDGTFQSAVNYNAGTQPSSVVVADLNGDGKMDLVVADLTNSSGNVSVLLGKGDGTFHPRVGYVAGSTPSTAAPRSVTLGDFNGDGIPDIAVANRGGNNLSFLLGNGDGSFQAATTLATGTSPQSITVGDFNGDGRPDLAVADSGSNKVSVLLGIALYPDLTLSASHSGNFTQGQAGAVYSLTVTNSGVVATSGIVSLTENLPGSMTAASIAGTGWACTLATLVCTRSDSLVAGGSYPAVTITVNVASNAPVLLTNSASVFGGGEAAGSSYSASDPTIVVQVTSVTLASSANPATLGQSLTLTATVAPSTATGTVVLYAGQVPIGDAIVLNGQAKFVTSLLPAGNLSLTAYYSGDATDQASLTTSPLSQTVQSLQQDGFQAALNYAVGNAGPVALATGDFNGDGIPDLAVVNSSASSKVSILLGTASSVFKSAVSYSTGGLNSAPIWVAVADVNGDGKPDIITANSNANNVSVLLGNGDGSFQPAVNYGVGTHPDYVVAGDFNRDGIVDIAVANGTSGNVSILLGSASGSFQAAVNYSAGTNPVGIVARDFNGDGITDLAVANSGSGNVTILTGNGDGTFQNAGSYSAGWNPNSIVSADFNGDGIADLAVVNSGSGNVSILLGQGGATFATAVNYLAGSGPSSIATGDMNGDGIIDLVVANSGSNNVSVLTGVGDGTFVFSANYAADGNPAAVVVADFNLDGLSDVAVANQSTNDISVLLGGMFYSDMTIAKSHTGNFSQGQTGALYTLNISNVGKYQSTGAVIVNDVKPASLTINSMGGTGWTCFTSTATCTRTDTLAAGASYPPITVTAKVSTGAPVEIVNTATVAGGGELNTSNDSATDTATVMQTALISLTASPSSFVYNQSVILTAAISPSAATGTVTLSDGSTALGTVTLFNGSASLSVASLSVGQHTLSAVYSGDAVYNTATDTLSGNVAQAAAQVSFSNLSQVYDGTAKSATVTTSPAGLSVTVTYSGSSSAPTAPGSYLVSATIIDPNYSGTATGTLVITRIAATVALSNLSAVYDGTAKSATASTSPAGLNVSIMYNGSSTVPVAAGTYSVVATILDPYYTGSATGTLVVSQASASLVLGGLLTTYTGSPQSISATTIPANLSVAFSYNGAPQAPTNAGTYSVIGTMNDPNYSGTATGIFVIAKAVAGVTVASATVNWDGTAKAATVVTVPAGLAVITTYNGSSTAPSSVGAYTVLATVNDANYTGSASGTLTIVPAPATITLGSLSAVYIGVAVPVSATTNPANLSVSVTYAGSSTPPVAAGSYAVVASITTPGYSGTASGTLNISKAIASVALSSLSAVYDGTSKVPVATTIPAGLQVDVSFTGLANAPSNAGSFPFTASINDPNYVGTATGTLTIRPAVATVQLGSLAAVYDGTPKSAGATTSPSGLGVTLTYNGNPAIPVAAGSYSVVGTVNSPNYTGTASGTLVISRASATVNVNGSTVVYDGTSKSASVSTVPASLGVIVTYNGSIGSPTAAGTYAVVATVSDPNYVGSGSGTETIQKATPVISWSRPASIIFGSALGSNQLNASAGVPGVFAYTPAAGTLMPVGSDLLSATFVPTDNVDFNSPVATTTINVVPNTSSTAAEIIGPAVLSRNGNNDIVVAVTLANIGETAAQNVILTGAAISSIGGTPLPQSVGAIQAQSSASATVVVPGSTIKSGSMVVMMISGTYTGGKFSTSTKLIAP